MLEEAVKIVEDAGFHSLPIESMDGGWRRLVVAARKGNKGQLTGHSFWVAELRSDKEFVLGMWSGLFYMSSNFDSFSQFVKGIFDYESDQILTALPSQFVDAFAVTEISVERFHELVHLREQK